MNARLPIIDERPKTYGDCLREGWGDHDATGPCPWVGCAHHLVWAVVGRTADDRRNIVAEPGDERLLGPLEEIDLDALPHTCVLRAAEEERTLIEVAEVLRVTRERIRQIERDALSGLDSYNTRPLLRALRDEGHEVSRPDLSPDNGWGLSRDEVMRATLRVDPAAVANFNASRTRTSAPAPQVRPLGPPVRVLQGAEREQRIRELKARGGAKQQPEETVMGRELADKESGRRVVAAIEKYAEQHGLTKTRARELLELSSSTFARAASVGCVPSLADRVEAAAKEPPKEAVRRDQRKIPPAAPAPSSSIASELARVAAVIDKLGGIDNAERLADVIEAAKRGAA